MYNKVAESRDCMIKNIIFDLGNVVVSFQPQTYFIKHFKDIDKTRDICHAVFDSAIWYAYDQGLYTKEEMKAQFAKQYPQMQSEITYVLDHWVKLMDVIPATIQLMKDLRAQGYPLYILSNLSEESYRYLKQEFAFFSLVQGSVLSFEEKINKPDLRIYNAVLDRYQLCATETIFIDDREDNIEAACTLGIHGIVYKNEQQVITDMKYCIEKERVC